MEDVASFVGGTLPASVILMMVFGLLWSPFAAIICLLIARVRGLRGDGYGSAGFRYSLLFLLPWIYLALRMAGVPVPRMVERIGYALLYGLWGVVALASVGIGLFTAGSFVLGDEDARGADAALFVVIGLFMAVLWFISLRGLLRRHGDRDDEPSVPMRVAYAVLHALWPLLALSIFFEGMFEFREFDKLRSAIPLWTCAGVMGFVWVLALLRFRFRSADRWDYPSNPRPDLLPPDPVYIKPFTHMYLMIVIPAAVGIVVFIFGVALL